MNKRAPRLAIAATLLIALLASTAAIPQTRAKPAEDPVVQKIIELGTT